MVKVCLISPEYLPVSGGTGAYVRYLSTELVKYDHSVYVIAGYDENSEVKLDENYYVFLIKTLKNPVIKSFLFSFLASKRLSEIDRRFAIDIAHANLPLVPSFAIPRSFEKKLISTVHSTWKGEADAIKHEPFSRLNPNEKFMVSFNWLLRIQETIMLERSDKIIAVSEYTKKELLANYRFKYDKIRVIHNGVDVNKFRPAESKSKVKSELGFNEKDKLILYVGRLYSRKGLFTLMNSIPLVVKKFKNAKFVVSGKGLRNEKDKFTRYAEKLGVKDNIIFTGYFPDKKLPKLYQAADIFVFSTIYENLPFAILEALASELPVVTTGVGGIPEVINDGKNGFLVAPFNPVELADRVLYLLENPAVASEVGLSGRMTVKRRFDWRIMVKKVIDVYAEALS
jgi:glycosyltransferase involved in cell wall biosynthesis